MSLSVTTDRDAIGALLEAFIATDPVRGTLLGTMRVSLQPTAWAVSDGGHLAVRSAAEWPVLVYGDWTADELVALAPLLDGLPGVCGVSGVPWLVAPLLDLMHAPPNVSPVRQRLFRLAELSFPDNVPGSARLATEADRALVRDWVGAFSTEVHDNAMNTDEAAGRVLASGCWLWCDADGAAVSLASRRPISAGSARIGPVFTPPEQRGRGYASAVTAIATREILDEGGIPVLFTDLANPTSNKIYQQLGYRPVEDRLVVTFG